MDSNQQKWVNLSFAGTSVLIAYVLYQLAAKFSVFLEVEGRVRSLDRILVGGAAVIGIGLFLGLMKNTLANTFMNETVAELSKVTWPTQDETMKATIATLIAVVLAGLVLWALDNLWISLIQMVI